MNILLATDGSESALQAVNFLERFPLPPNCRLTLLTVLDKEPFRSENSDDLSARQVDELHQTKAELKGRIEDSLSKQAASLSRFDGEVTTVARSGYPAETILLTAAELAADLIVLGSHGLTGIRRFFLGSVSQHVVESADCSVLIVKHDPDEGPSPDLNFPRILLAYDGSTPADRAVEFLAGLPLAEATRVHALTIMPMIKMFRQDITQRLSWVWQEKRLLAENALKRITHEVRWGHPRITTELKEAEDVSEEILDTAERDHSNLIVLGNKGKGAIDRFLLGSVTSRVVHHAECSVLVVKS